MKSPYQNKPSSTWPDITDNLIKEHPLDVKQIVDVVHKSWSGIFASKIGGHLQIGRNIFPKPQIMGFFLHELIPLNLEKQHPEYWRRELIAEDKDIVCTVDPKYSIEIKTSSDKKHIFGNRSYAEGSNLSTGKKDKSGYYLCVNFEKFENDAIINAIKLSQILTPRIVLIRFGWIDSSDWIGQKASTGQQARLSKEVYDGKMQILFQE
ncbi:MAG: ScaI family restriction endonuclease [Planctomycetaceae bacterium]|nr:ScaI family restriction endonuclease [Planctomycetaceae bacterium]